MNPLVLAPALDDRYGVGRVTSRIGLDTEAIIFQAEQNLLELVAERHEKKPVHCVLIDEAQFMSREQVYQSGEVCDRLDIPVREQTGVYEPVSIGEDSWVGERATVAASVGKHCVVGAGSLVLSPLPDYAVAVGVPAKIIRDRRDLSESKAELQAPVLV